jgi:hypothetical protein
LGPVSSLLGVALAGGMPGGVAFTVAGSSGNSGIGGTSETPFFASEVADVFVDESAELTAGGAFPGAVIGAVAGGQVGAALS